LREDIRQGYQVHIGVAGPSSWKAIQAWLPANREFPPIFTFPLIGQLAAGLRSRGHDISIFTTSTSIGRPEEIVGDGLRVFIAPMRSKRSAYDFYRKECPVLQQAMRFSRCDILHAHWCYEFAAAALDSGKPTLVTCHDNPNEEHRFARWTRAYPFWWLRCFFGRRVVRRAPFLSAVSPYVADNLQKICKGQNRPWVVPNGVSSSLFQQGRIRMASPRQSGPFTVASVLEGFGKRKNARTALRAFALHRSRFPDSRYFLFGADYQRGGAADRWAQRRGLSEGVEFRGHTPQIELHAFLAAEADVLLHPALLESHPMAIIESMALGVTVVGGQESGGVAWTLESGQAGVLTNVRDPREIASALGTLAQSPERRGTIAQRAWTHADRFFRQETMLDEYLRIYPLVMHA